MGVYEKLRRTTSLVFEACSSGGRMLISWMVRVPVAVAEPLQFSFRSVLDWCAICSEDFMLKNFHAFQVSTKFYQESKRLKLPHFLRDQLLRASSSITLNIAEGSGRRTKADQAKSYAIAFGSLRECQAIFALEDIQNPTLLDLADQLGAMLYKLSNASNRTTNKN